jgi:hypothetical protein
MDLERATRIQNENNKHCLTKVDSGFTEDI